MVKIARNKALYKNAASLYLLQGINYLLPLVTVPYLIRVLGAGNFGLLAFAGSVQTYFQTVIDYGFNLSATREVSIHRENDEWLSEHYYSIVTIKSLLAICCFIILLCIVTFIPRFHNNGVLYCWLFLGVAGSVFFPTWLFQGMERMGYITVLNLGAKVAVSVLYFIFIKEKNDYMWFAYLNAIGVCAVSLIGFFIAIRIFKIKYIRPRVSFCRENLKNGFHIFISQLSVTLFTNTNTFVLGIFCSNQIVGLYAIAEKIIRAFIGLTGPIGSAIFPKTSLLFSQSKAEALRFIKKVFVWGTMVFGTGCCCIWIFADYLVLIVTGEKSQQISLLIRIMSFLPLSVFWDNIFGTQIMLNCKLQKQFTITLIGSGIFSLVLLPLLIPHFQATGAAISFLCVELFLMILMLIIVRRTGIRFFPKISF